LPLDRVIGPYFLARADYIMNGVVSDQTACEGFIQVKRTPRAFYRGFWGWARSGPENMILNQFRQFQRMGMNANFGNRKYDVEAPAFNKLNMAFSVQGMGMYANRGTTKAERLNPKDPEKPQTVVACARPDMPEKRREAGRKAGERYRQWNAVMYSMGDENRGPGKDICFSDAALGALRKWLKETQYASLDALNAEWKTHFTSWESVMPMTEAEVKAHGEKTGSYAAWADQRQFNKWSYARMAKVSVEGIVEGDPEALAGASGTQNTEAYGGRDWWHLARAYTALAAYGGPQTIEQMSFHPEMIRYQWSGYSKPAPIIRVGLWRILGENNHGFFIFSAANHINPDYTLPEVGRDLRAATLQTVRGPGRIMTAARMSNDGVYILQSPMSIHGAYITGSDSARRKSRLGVEQLLSESAIGYRAVSYEQLAKGHLERVGGRALVLPYAVAMSDAECEAVRRFVQKGGLVVADVDPAVMTEHCRKREGSALAALFEHERFVHLRRPLFEEYAGLRTKLTERDSLERHLAIQGEFETILKRAGVTPAFVVRNTAEGLGLAGERTPWLWSTVKDNGDIRYVTIGRDYTVIGKVVKDQPVRVTFNRNGYIYDILDGMLLGEGNEVDMTIVHNTLRVFALLPYRVERVEMSDVRGRTPLGENLRFTAQIVATGTPAEHWLRLDVIAPDGTVRGEYSKVVRAPGGQAEIVVPFALNDPEGEWTICVTDVATGCRAETKVTLQ